MARVVGDNNFPKRSVKFRCFCNNPYAGLWTGRSVDDALNVSILRRRDPSAPRKEYGEGGGHTGQFDKRKQSVHLRLPAHGKYARF